MLSWKHESRLVLCMSLDALFAVTTFAFLFMGERYGAQRNSTYPRYPGAFEKRDHGVLVHCLLSPFISLVCACEASVHMACAAGPWVELSGMRRFPKHFNLYLQARCLARVSSACLGSHCWVMQLS